MATYYDLEQRVYEGFVIAEVVNRDKGRTFLLVKRDGSEEMTLNVANRSLASHKDMLNRLIEASREADGKGRVWWCLKCEQTFRQPERQLLGQQCPVCKNRGSVYRWASDEWPRSENPDYPEIPELGKVYPLYPEKLTAKRTDGDDSEDRHGLVREIQALANEAMSELQYWASTGELKVLQDAQNMFMHLWERVLNDEIRHCRLASGSTISQSPGE